MMTDTVLARPASNVRLIPIREVEALTGFRKSQLYEWAAAGKFPTPIHPLGSSRSLWPAAEVEAWIHERIAAERGRP